MTSVLINQMRLLLGGNTNTMDELCSIFLKVTISGDLRGLVNHHIMGIAVSVRLI